MPGDHVTVPDEYDEWPWEAKRFVLAEANSAAAIRREINNIVGLDNDDDRLEKNAGGFAKDELAAVLMALGGPDGA